MLSLHKNDKIRVLFSEIVEGFIYTFLLSAEQSLIQLEPS